MLTRLTHKVGGYALSRRELRLLYAAIFLSFLGASITFPLWMLYAQRHHASPAQLGLMAGAFLLAPLCAQLPMGWLVDRWGRVPVLLLGLIGHPMLSLLYIMFNAPAELIALRFLEGVTVSALQPAISAYIADVTPEEHRSEAFGALGATLNAGLFIGPLIGGVIGQYFGFTTAFVVTFAVEILAVPLVWGHVREPIAHRARGGVRRRTSWRDLISIPLASVYVTFLCIQVIIGTLSALWAIWIHDLGGSYTFIGITFTVFALPQILFGATAGRLADRRGRAHFLLISGLVAGAIYVSYGFVTSLVVILVLGVIEGLVIIFQQPLAQGLLADASPAEARGRAQGMAGAIGAIGGSAAAFLSPPLYHESRLLPFVLLGAITIAGSAVAAVGAVTFARQRQAQILASRPERRVA